MRILVIEDEPTLNKLISKQLALSHYSVDSCLDGIEAEDFIAMAEYDCIVLDVMLPGKDGFEILKEMRNAGNDTPVLMLTARGSIEDRVRGLTGGADDYLTKPFAFEELLARISALIRRSSGGASNTFTLSDLTVDCDARTVTRSGENIEVTSKEFAVLEYLIRNKGIVLSREKISAHIWNYDYEGGSNIVDVYIRYLRAKIDEGHGRKLIHTVRGAGYVLREN